MLAQKHLALPLPNLLLDLGLDLLLGLDQFELPLYVNQHPAQSLLDTARLQQRLPALCRDVEIPGDEIREPPRIFHTFEHLFYDFLGQPHLQAQLRRPLPHLAVQRHERRILGVERWKVGCFLYDGLDKSLCLRILEHRRTIFTVQEQLNAAQSALDLPDLGYRSGRVQHVGLRLIHVLALRDREDQFVLSFHRRFNGTKRGGAAGSDRSGHARKHHGLPEGEDR